MDASALQLVERGWRRLGARDMILLLRALHRKPDWLFDGIELWPPAPERKKAPAAR